MAGPLYLPPGEEVLQGDIYSLIPSIHVESRPVRVARIWKESPERITAGIHDETGHPTTPQGGFKWLPADGGELVLARGYLALGVLMSHDCEIENDPDHRIVAMVRPITDIQPEHRPAILEGRNYAAFPLQAQETDPAMELAFVDFRRLTSIRGVALADDGRFASLNEDLRKALRRWFWLYLSRPLQQAQE